MYVIMLGRIAVWTGIAWQALAMLKTAVLSGATFRSTANSSAKYMFLLG